MGSGDCRAQVGMQGEAGLGSSERQDLGLSWGWEDALCHPLIQQIPTEHQLPPIVCWGLS